MATPTKSKPFQEFIDEKIKQKREELSMAPRRIVRDNLKLNMDTIRCHLTFDTSDTSDQEMVIPKKKRRLSKKGSTDSTDLNDSGLFSSSTMQSPDGSPTSGIFNKEPRFRQLSPPPIDMSSDDSEDSLLDLPIDYKPNKSSFRKKRTLQKALDNVGATRSSSHIVTNSRVTTTRVTKRKQESPADEPDFKIMATPRRRGRVSRQKENSVQPRIELQQAAPPKIIYENEECDSDYRLEFSYDEPLDGRSWVSDRPKVDKKICRAEESMETDFISSWLIRLGFEEDSDRVDSLESDISDYSINDEGILVHRE